MKWAVGPKPTSRCADDDQNTERTRDIISIDRGVYDYHIGEQKKMTTKNHIFRWVSVRLSSCGKNTRMI